MSEIIIKGVNFFLYNQIIGSVKTNDHYINAFVPLILIIFAYLSDL